MLTTNFSLLLDFWMSFLKPDVGTETRFRLLIFILVSIFVFGRCLTVLLPKTLRASLESVDVFSLALPLGIAFLLLLGVALSSISVSLKINLPLREILLFLFLVSLLFVIYDSRVKDFRPSLRSMIVPAVLLLLFLGLLALRLPFIHPLTVPQYSDSVEHFQIIQDILHPQDEPRAFYRISRIFIRYYHFGYHALAAWFVVAGRFPVQETMLVFGQVLQAVIPLSLFLPVKISTKSNLIALMTILFAGLAWRMPSFASNWGKYPALTSLVLLPLPILLSFWVWHAKSRKDKFVLALFTIFACLALFLAHTRSMILLFLIVSSCLITCGLFHRRYLWKISALAIVIFLLIIIAFSFLTDPALVSVFHPYWRDGAPATVGVMALSLVGLKYFPRETANAFVLFLSILVVSIVPLPFYFHQFGYQSLLDRPFVQTSLFIPLSLLGGIGSGRLVRWMVDTNHKFIARFSYGIVLFLCLLLAFYSLSRYELAPSFCCQLLFADDESAFNWINSHLPDSSLFLVAGNRTTSRNYGVDGGLWLSPLTGYNSQLVSNRSPFESLEFHQQICRDGITQIYIGGTSARFSVEQISSQSGWYKNIYTMPGAYIFEIINCSK